MIDPSDRRTHIERINDDAAKDTGMTEAQFQAFLAHQTEQIDRLIAATAELLAPVVAAAEMQVAYMERVAQAEADAEQAALARLAESTAAAEQAARDAEKRDGKSDKKAADKA